jgi:rubrerythrin
MYQPKLFGQVERLVLDRRRFFTGASQVTLSAGAIALLTGCGSLARDAEAKSDTMADDAAILNTALGAEREAVAAYQIGAESGLLSAGVLQVAVKFQDHHKQHADVLAKTIKQLGGTPDDAPAKYDFPVSQLKSEADVLRFAAGLEKGAVSAYLGAVPLFGNRDLSKAAASILGDEAMHWAVLRGALGEDPVPVAFVS